MQRDKGEKFCLDNEARGRTEANARAYLDGGVDGVADDGGVGLPGAEPDRRDLGAGVEDEVAGHTSEPQNLWWSLPALTVEAAYEASKPLGSHRSGLPRRSALEELVTSRVRR